MVHSGVEIYPTKTKENSTNIRKRGQNYVKQN